PEQKRRLAPAAIDRRNRLAPLRRVGDAAGRQRIDDLDVEPVPLDELVAAAAVEDDSGQLVSGLFDRRPAHPIEGLSQPVGGKDRQPLLPRRHQHDHHPGARLGAVLLVERKRRLVAMVTVGDEQLGAREAPAGVVFEPPEPVAPAGQIGLSPRELDRKSTRLNSSHVEISYAVFCLKKKKQKNTDMMTKHQTLLTARKHSDRDQQKYDITTC